MCDGDDGSLILVQVLLQPVNALSIKVVGRLVEQQHVGFLQEQTTQCHTSAFASRELTAQLVGRRAAQCVHGPCQACVEVPGIGGVNDVLQFTLTCEELVHLVLVFIVLGQSELLVYLLILGQGIHYVLHTLFHNLTHCLVVVEVGLLRQVAYRIARCKHHVALIALVETGYDFQQS